MVFTFKFPDVGEGITEGELIRWKVKENDLVKVDQVVAEIETDKAIVEIPAPKAGKVIKLHYKEGETVRVGSNLITFAEEGEPLHQEEIKPKEEPENHEGCKDGVCPLPPLIKKEETVSKKEEKIAKKEKIQKKDAGAVVGQLPEYEEPVAAHQYFFLKTGEQIRSLAELKEKLTNIDDDTFSHHVNEYKNDFAQWVQDVMANGALATALRNTKSKQEMINMLSPKEKVEEQKSDAKAGKAMPAVRKLATEKNIDLASLQGSGKQGEITKEDVLKAAGQPVEQKKQEPEKSSDIKLIKREYDLYGYIETIPLKGTRKAIARNVERASQRTAAVTLTDEIDVSALHALKEREKEMFAEKGLKNTYLVYIIKAVVKTLESHPYLNAVLDDEREEIIVKKYYNIGIAVDTEQGLMVPVLKIAQHKSLEEVAAEIVRLADGARQKKLNVAEVRDSTFTVTNVGSIGGIFATPIINYPETAILLLGRIMEKPVVRDDTIQIRKIMPVSLTVDHRIIDGAEAARFINDLKKILEDPDLIT